MPKFRFLEHTADVYIAAYGRNLAEAFENAALAMFEVMTDTDSVQPLVEDMVEVKAYDKPSLLYNWLEELLIKFEVSNMLYSKFKILKMEEDGETIRLTAEIWGEPFDETKHKQKIGVKAVTYHQMEIQEKPGKATLKFILDI